MFEFPLRINKRTVTVQFIKKRLKTPSVLTFEVLLKFAVQRFEAVGKFHIKTEPRIPLSGTGYSTCYSAIKLSHDTPQFEGIKLSDTVSVRFGTIQVLRNHFFEDFDP